MKTLSSDRLAVAAAAFGGALFVTPWALAYWDVPAPAWHAWVMGGGLALIAGLVRYASQELSPLFVGIAGAWIGGAPWLLGFSAVTAAMASHVAVGLVLLVLGTSSEILNQRRCGGPGRRAAA